MRAFNYNLDEDTKVYEFKAKYTDEAYLVFAKNSIEACTNKEARQYKEESEQAKGHNDNVWDFKCLGWARDYMV